MNDKYFQAIIQLRNPRPEVRDYLDRILGSQLSRVERVRNGLDFYVKDKKVAEIKARQVRDLFGGEFNVAASLHTRDHQTSRDLYRLNILVRLPDFKKGDVLKIGKDLFRVKGLGKKVDGVNLRTWKNKTFNYPENYEVLEKHKTQVIKVTPSVEVLHPETYQNVSLQNKPVEELVVGQKVSVVVDSGVYLV